MMIDATPFRVSMQPYEMVLVGFFSSCKKKRTVHYPWTSRVQNHLYPDFIIIDLDPSDNDFKKALSAALAAKEIFYKQKLKMFPKTSGKTGIH